MKKWVLFFTIFTFAVFISSQDEVNVNTTNEVETIKIEPPSELAAKALNDHTISLRWQDTNDKLTGFVLYRKSAESGFDEIQRLEKNNPFYVDQNLKYNVNYSYKVQAYIDDNFSEFSDEIALSTIFPKPTNIKVKPIDDQSVKITWQDNCDFETGYLIERRSMETDYKEIGRVSENVIEFVDQGLISGEKYYYHVKAESKYNVSLASDKVTVEATFPAPTNFQVNSLDDQSIRLTWDDKYNYEKGFKIYRKTGNDDFIEIAVTEADARYYIDEKLEDGKTYVYNILAFTDINESRPSKTESAELKFPSPQKLYIEVLNDHSAKLYWVDSSNLAESYILERMVNDGDYEVLKKLNKNDRDYLDENMQLGGEYTYRIKAKSKINESEYSNEIGTKTDFPGPENLYVENIDDQSLKLYWEDNCAFETGYRLERKVSGGEFQKIADLEPNQTHYLDSGLTFGINYNYRVIAFTQESESAYSNILSTKTIFPEPTYLSVLIIDDQALKLSWVDNCAFDEGFRIERKMGKQEFVVIKELPADVTTYLDSGLQYGSQYIYRIAAKTKTNISNFSSEIIARTVFPEPAYLSSEILDDRTVTIYWEDKCDFETGFVIERKIEDGEFTKLVDLAANTTSYTDKSLQFEKTYYYRVQATTAVNGSDFSNVEYVSTIFPPPSDLTVEIVSAALIKLKWHDNCYFEKGYQIERSKNNGSYKILKKSAANVVEYTDKDLSYDSDYSYRIAAFTDINTSHYTNTVMKYYGLITPANYKLDVIADRQVKLSWEDNSNIEEGFRIQRRTENEDFKTIASVPANSEMYIDKNTKVHTRYYYRISSFLNRNLSPFSEVKEAICHFGKRRVPEDHPTIQSAINFAVSGDTVIVQPGTYKENINFEGKNITVTSNFFNTQDKNYINTTIIDGKEAGSVVNFQSEETKSAKLIGFTLENGTGNEHRGGGIFIYNSSPTIMDVIIQNNKAEKFGGGIYQYNSNSLLENCIIRNNTSVGTKHGYGGGVYLNNSNPVLKKLEILDNQANEFGGGIYIYNSNPELIRCVIAGNEVFGTEHGYGGGIYTQYSNSTWCNLTISNNKAKYGGAVYCNSFSNPKINNSILWDNLPQEVCFHKFGDIKMTLSYSNIMNAEDGFETNNNGSLFFKMGVINADPMFKDPVNRNYNLLADSPCIDAGDPSEEYNDSDGSRNDMGAIN
ncbi:MAG: fibronectin type III domain-containing protein [Candidatus Cloacimonetes bacterium]|nr:fibronectin type III domain-containing protein [Candidatus Cloacimonadota bacterium]